MLPPEPNRASSPMKVSGAGMLPFYPHEPDFKTVRDILEREMRCSLVGAQPVEQFLNTFLPLPSDVDPGSVPSIDFSRVIVSRIEKASYPGLVRVVLVSCGSNGHANSPHSRLMLSTTQKLFLAF